MATRLIHGVDYFYSDRGSGLPVVLLHAFPVDSRIWEAQVADLSAHCHAIAPDFRGFGQSHDNHSFTIETLADDVHALLQEIDGLPCVLAGISMGGYTAMAFARKYWGDLRGLILVDTKAEADTPQQKEGRQKSVELAQAQGASAIADLMIPKLLAEDALQARPGQTQALRKIIETCPVQTIVNALYALRDRPDQSEFIGSIRVPTLIVVGEKDSITPVAVAESMRSRIRGAQLEVIKGAGHLAPFEQPAQVNRAIGRFVGSLE
jgi:pimeloyl-ACP methyl ester carboxylesterase